MKPFGYWHQGASEEESDFLLFSESGNVACSNCVVLYTQQQVDELVAQNEELQRKLAEQQAELLRHRNHAHCCLIQNSGAEELNNLLAKAKEEGRKEAVPEGWKIVPKEPTEEMTRAAFRHCYIDSQISIELECYKVMLAAAPKP